MTPTEVMKQALEALEKANVWHSVNLHETFVKPKITYAITNLRTAIEQMEKQEPFAWYLENEDEFMTEKLRKEHERVNSYTFKLCKVAIPLYPNTAPAVPERWQPIETAPKDGTKVLIVNDEGEMDVAGYVEYWVERTEFVRKAKDGDVYRTVRDDCGYWDTDTAYCPTHWMPLPAAPEASCKSE